MLAKAEAT